jgi:hypothetical protein
MGSWFSFQALEPSGVSEKPDQFIEGRLMGIFSERFRRGEDVYVRNDLEEMMFRWDHATGKWYRMFLDGINQGEETEVIGGMRESNVPAETVAHWDDEITAEEYWPHVTRRAD